MGLVSCLHKTLEIFDEMTLVFEYCPMTLTSRIKSGLTEYECHKFMNDIGLYHHIIYTFLYNENYV